MAFYPDIFDSIVAEKAVSNACLRDYETAERAPKKIDLFFEGQ